MPLADDRAEQATAAALRAVIDLERGRPAAAVDRATAALATTPVNDIAHLVASWSLVSAMGDLGRIDEIEAVANAGYLRAESSAEASHLRWPLTALQAIAYRIAGALTSLDTIITRIRHDTIDVPFQQAWLGFLVGMSAMSRGDLAAAQRVLQETLAHLESGGRMVKGFSQSWLTVVTGMAGQAADARREFAALESLKWWDPEDASVRDAEKPIAEAWVCAAEGAVSQAISITRDAAAKQSERGRAAWEVMLLQTATQFGDHTTAARLSELAQRVQGPRARAAAAHAAALAAGSGDALVDASGRYEAFGDRIAAADAAAQAVLAYQRVGRRGTAMIALAIARRLADECGGAQTPALRAATVPVSITARQREIISLAAKGMSNKEIAEQLSMSVRSVQGHLFRASQRVGVNSRNELIAILQGQ